jgi:hypothetical protein
MSDGVELATDCREAGFMITKSSATTATTAATAPTRAATLNSAARSKSRVRLAGSLVAFGTSEAGRDIEDDLMGSGLAACETNGPSFAALSLNRRGV